VGRAPHVAALEACLERAAAGTGQVLLISGEAGIGKSRLVTEALARAQAAGYLVLQGACYETDRALPYAAFIDLLRAYFSADPGAAAAVATVPNRASFGALVAGRVKEFYLGDKACPLTYEPSGEDFLSPCLAEADAVRRVLASAEFGRWMTAFMPRLEMGVTRVSDVTDGKAYHLAGLNLSRAWMLEGVVSKLPAGDSRRAAFSGLAAKLRAAGLESIRAEHYEGGHWLGSFAVYLVSGRGLR